MDDIKRTKHSRPRIALPERRRIDLQAPFITRPSPEEEAVKVIKRPKSLLVVRLKVPPMIIEVYKKLHLQRVARVVRPYLPSRRKHPALARLGWGLMTLVILGPLVFDIPLMRQRADSYVLSAQASTLLESPVPIFGERLKLHSKQGLYAYNEGYHPGQGVAGLAGGPKFTANFPLDAEQGVTVTDPALRTQVMMRPKFDLARPIKDQNRLLYPIKGKDALKVYTLQASGFKEDIVLNSFQGDTLSFEYEMELPSGTEARMEPNGSVAVYGVSPVLLGNVSTGSDKDAKLLEKARKNGEKNKLLFSIPAPFVKEYKNKTGAANARAWFSLSDNVLTIHAAQLDQATYPLSIDPSIYIESAAQLMRGNNESNVEFDTANQLIQKGQTTGARIDGWTQSTEMNSGIWNQATAAAGGYVYRAGGRIDPTMPYVASQQSSVQATDSLTFTMNMPSTRPAGDLYVALIAKNGNNRVTGPAGWTEVADLQQYAAYYKEGTDQGGGNEAATYQWTVATTAEEWTGVILRIKNFNSGSPLSTTTTTGSSASDAVPVFPAITPAHDATLNIRAAGFDDDEPSPFGWLPSGHTALYAGTSTTDTTTSAGLVVAMLDTPPLASNAAAAATLTDDGLVDDTYGASTISIRPATVTAGVQTSVQWAKFNATTGTIDSPNPGTGTCSGWCSNSAYNLPAARMGMSMVAYNGYLYAMGGSTDGTAANGQTTVWVAKLGANGEPQLWHPSGGTPGYWFVSASVLPAARMYTAAVAYNNKMYLVGGQGTAGTSLNTVHVADILPTGDLTSWTTTGMQDLTTPTARHGHSVHVYNDVMYIIGGNSSGTLRNTVYYSKINADGTMNAWQATSNFTTPRASFGGTMTAVWGGYIYLAGGCSALSSGFCSTVASDVQLVSINSDGTLGAWNSILNLSNQRIGYGFIAWQNGLYRFGGCNRQNVTTGVCYAVQQDVDYGIINPDGDASTVNNSVPANTGSCVTPNYFECDLPAAGDGAEQGGQMASVVVFNNGYIYVIGGCTSVAANDVCETGGTAQSTGNTLYAALDSGGHITRAGTCTGTFVTNSSWCADSTNTLNGTTGISAAAGTVFNNTIYVFGGTTGASAAAWTTNVYRVNLLSTGGLSGAWTTDNNATTGLPASFPNSGGATGVGYSFVFARANPSAASTVPGNLFIMGGCSNGTGLQCGTSSYNTGVYKCNIGTTAQVTGCTTTGQLQIDSDPIINTGSQGLGLMAGTVFANRIYLVGGACPQTGTTDTAPCGADYWASRRDTIYAKIDDNNNIVDNDSGTATTGDNWTLTTGQMDPVRRRGVAFGYNGYIYSLAGASSGTTALQDLLFAKVDVSTGDMGTFDSSGVVVTPRWDLRAVVSNGYVYAIGGCGAGSAPTGCTDMQEEIQTFQLYNNDSGAPADFLAVTDDTFAASTDRIGASAAVLNGYLYVAGGCTNIACGATQLTTNVQYAPLSVADGTISGATAWVSATNGLPAVRAWGQLEVAGGNLYYLGGQDDTGDEKADVYYAGTFSSGDISAAWSGATGDIGDTASQAAQDRTKFGAAVWNNRIYVVGGLNDSAAVTNTVYISPQLNSGGDIAADSWVSDTDVPDVARSGNMVVAYANNLYTMGGNNGTQYLNDSQFTQINSDGTVDAWTFTTSLPGRLSDGEGFAYNGYMYLIGGRSAATTCLPNTIVAPISANTTIASGNNPTGLGEWYETNEAYTQDRFGAAVAYAGGKIFVLGGGCSALVTTSRHWYTSVKSQPQIAKYSRLIDTDTDVFPNSWLLNGLDNSIGAQWYAKYRSMHDISDSPKVNPNEDCGTSATMPTMTTWGQETNFGAVTLGKVGTYTPLNSSGGNINCARYFSFSISIDSSQAFGYPEDVSRGPTIYDLSLFFTADPSKRLRHGKTFTGGEQQPLDTPCRQSNPDPNAANCPLP